MSRTKSQVRKKLLHLLKTITSIERKKLLHLFSLPRGFERLVLGFAKKPTKSWRGGGQLSKLGSSNGSYQTHTHTKYAHYPFCLLFCIYILFTSIECAVFLSEGNLFHTFVHQGRGQICSVHSLIVKTWFQESVSQVAGTKHQLFGPYL